MSRTRIKADPLVIGGLDRAESAMMELAELSRQVRAVKDGLNADIDRLKENAAAAAAPLEARRKELTDALGTFLKMHRAEVLKGRKSIELAFGIMGFRASSSVVQMRGVTAEMSLERLKNSGLTEGIRIKEELDKDVMRGWPDDRLALVGLLRQEKDQFFVEVKEENLSENAA
jgi:phage host-nuclease inhibitor protein Gam